MRKRLIEKLPKFEVEPDLLQLLGVDEQVGRAELDKIYAEIYREEKEFDLKKYLAWKVLRDDWYRELYLQTHSVQALFDAGFFIDKIEPGQIEALEFKPGFLTTPFHKIVANLKQLQPGKKPVVLLTTGGFSPIHHGHISMLEVAKEKLEKEGMQVVGGYFSPSHDDYVSTKYGGEAELNSAHRIHLVSVAVNDSDWMMVDPWEAAHVPTDINFTDVIKRLEAYLRHYVPGGEALEVYYVFGADNAGFVRVFKNKNGCVCISREGVDFKGVDQEEGIAGNSKIHFTKNLSNHANYSSSTARKWKANLMPDEVSYLYFKWRKNILSMDGMTLQPRKLYIIRDEDDWALEPWINKVGESKLLAAKEEFKNNLAHAIRNAFLHTALPDLPVDVDIRFYQLEPQRQFVEQLKRQEQVLNLDVCTNEGEGLNFSRKFYLSDGQFRSRELLARPGFAPLEKQIADIKPGTYTLIDDDIASGSTINMLMGLLPENVRINKIRTLMDFSRRKFNQSNLGTFDQDAFDVVDLRDFIFGSKASGLVVDLPNGQMARAPYLRPYISLISRASIPPSTEMMLSKRIVELNLEFFQNLAKAGGGLLLSDFDEYTQKLFNYLGYAADTTAEQICQEHLKVWG